MNSKEENSLDFCLDFVQEFGLLRETGSLVYRKVCTEKEPVHVCVVVSALEYFAHVPFVLHFQLFHFHRLSDM